MESKCASLRARCSSHRMEDTLSKAFLRYQQQRGHCPCRDCVAKAKHFTIRVHKMLEVQSLYKPTPPHQPTAKRRRLRLTSVPLVDLRAPPDDGSCYSNDLYGSLNSPPRSLASDVDAHSLSAKSGICSMSESMDSQRLGTSSIRIKHLTSSWETESRFPKLNECAHFHYECVELGPIDVCLFTEVQENSKAVANSDVDRGGNFAVQVSSNGKSWVVRRSYENFRMLDRQLHQCIYDRKFSALPEIPKDDGQLEDGEERSKTAFVPVFTEYLQRFSDIAGNLINCGPILNWLELDNRGNRLIVTDDSAINTPAVAAAYVTKRYIGQAADEISFEVGDMISVIDMPPPEESIWWRGKRGFEVGFFPSECVEVIGDKVPHAIHIPKAPTKPVLRKHGKLIAFFRSFILSRPSRRKLKQSGILKERVFGCDLGEHLLNSGHDIPMVLKCCADFIESHGVVDGIFRLSGVTSNIQKLRNTFDEDRVPDLNDEAILQDIHCVASLLKMYFRELPNPLLTYQLYDKFVAAVQSDEQVRLLNIRDVVQQLPPPHYRTLEYLVKHLARVAAHGAETGMTPKNVAIVWAPNLLRSKDLEVGGVAALQVVGVQAVVTEFLIHYSDLIFNDKMPAFAPCPGSAGTPRRSRPKSLAISTPTKLLSLEEARSRALGSGIQYNQKYIEVGGGPATLPSTYHTVIDLPDRKRTSTKNKKSPSGWKSFFSKGKSSSQSTRDREKNKARRKPSSTPSDPGVAVNLSGKAITETDVLYNNNRLRSVKSAESLISSGAACSHRNSDVIDSGSLCIPFSGINGKSGQDDCDDVLSSSLDAVSSAQMRQSPHSHIRSISHDSYFEFAFDKRKEDKPGGELSTILSDDNDEDSDRIAMEDFRDVATDLDLMKLRYVDQDTDSSPLGHFENGAGSTTLDETTASLLDGFGEVYIPKRPPDKLNLQALNQEAETLDTLGSESLQEQLSLDFENGYCDIVGDIQKEVASALHWGETELESFAACPSAMAAAKQLHQESSVTKRDFDTSCTSPEATKSSGKVVVERYGSEKTVIVEVHATEDSSADEEDGGYEQKGKSSTNQAPSPISAQDSLIIRQISFSDTSKEVPSAGSIDNNTSSKADSLLPFDSLEGKPNSLVSDQATRLQEEAYADSLEYSILMARPSSDCAPISPAENTESKAATELFTATAELAGSSETNIDSKSRAAQDNEMSDKCTESIAPSGVEIFHDINSVNMYDEIVKEAVPKIFVRESTLPTTEDQYSASFQVNHIELNSDGVILHSAGLEPMTNAIMDSDSSPGSQANSMDEVSSSTSPSASGDPFGYSVLMNEEEVSMTPLTETLGEIGTEMMDFAISDQRKEALHPDSVEEPSVSSTSKIFSDDAKHVADSMGYQGQEMTPPSPLNICPMDAAIPVSPLPSPMSPSRDLEDSNIGQLRTPCLLMEKLSPVEESKRKFESEIGRDILRERKMKLEFEKIQLEQMKMEKTSPTVLKTSLSDGGSKLLIDFEAKSPSESSYRRGNFDSDLVELRQVKANQEAKRSSDPTSPQKENTPFEPSGDPKRHSEPGAFVVKSNRPERKASVRELMSKFERKPKVEIPWSSKENVDVDTSKTLPSPSIKSPGEMSPSVDSIPDRPNSIHLFVKTQKSSSQDVSLLASAIDSLTDSLPVNASSDACVLIAKPNVEVELTSPMTDMLMIGDSENSASWPPTKIGDVARRERIDRYKEERRAQLRERIKSESFKGEQDLPSDYLARLKQKASSPTKLASSSEDLVDLPTSPNRRSRLSAVSLGSPTESGMDKEVFVSRRRSFNTRGSFSSTTGSEESTPPVSPRKVAREKGCGLPIPPSSPRKLQAHVPSLGVSLQESTDVAASEIGTQKLLANRPKELLTAPPGSRKSVLQKKESPTDGTARKLKSPMKERTFNLPPSPTKDKLISIRDDVSCRKDFKGNKTSPISEKAPSSVTHKSKIPKSGGPMPPPRKIKDVAAIFEPDLQLGEHHPDNVASMKPKPLPKPAPSIVQRQMSLNTEESKDSSSAQRWKSKHPSGT